MAIIGGPALRRVEVTHAYVWVVLDHRANSIDAVAKTTLAGKSISRCIASSKTPVALGDSLFAYMLKIEAVSGSFPINKKIYYDVSIDGNNLSSLGLISGKKPIVYKGEGLPSFVIPDKHRNILQASCRKPHSNSDGNQPRDQMSKVDGLIGKTVNNTMGRPTMLFLTGDQIYADDVAAPLLASIRDKAVQLTGWEEVLPKHNNKSIVPAKLKLNGRDKVLSKRGMGFSSGEKKNHLMCFGEYIAMYLITWGGLDVDLPEYDDIKNNIVIGKIKTGPRKGRVKNYRVSRLTYNNELKRVRNFLSTTWRMRRLMANISTYMIFDDHDVTDDWNLSKRNSTKFKKVPISRRISSNALAAYWVCQGWGNNPGDFKKTFKIPLQNYLISKSPNNGNGYEKVLANSSWGYIIDSYPICR